ncbi:hypothetical protein KIN20_035748 [Parelaphostrongylus tenuis]|uniref:Uncharacterized protein n=1 Tax=Parelaphostrongylus tenuis TaxID=148309 RepID=A0AAD5WKQ0_PARTN|nr:hypothetical protein KIN20_035748 [Parelaphostrongylus tenuis]
MTSSTTGNCPEERAPQLQQINRYPWDLPPCHRHTVADRYSLWRMETLHLFRLRETKPSTMTAPYDYSAYSAMDPHVLQMADISAGYWGTGAPPYTPLGGLPPYPPLSSGTESDYTAPARLSFASSTDCLRC